MDLLSPWALALLALGIPLAAMYLRRRRREKASVPSLELWRAVQRDLAAQTGLQRFRGERSLWLQLLALALTALALAGPVRRQRVSPAQRLVLVVDTSASMGARDGSSTRLDLARSAALQALAESERGSEAALVVAGCSPRVAVASTRDRGAITAAVEGLRPEDCGGDLSRALSLAADRLRGATGSRRVLVLTDGATRADALGVSVGGRVDVLRVGRPAANVGIAAMELRPDPDGSNAPGGERRYGLFVALVPAHLDAPREVTLEVDLLRGDSAERVAVRSLTLHGARVSATLPIALAPDERADIVRTRVVSPGPDALAVDDLAYAPVPAGQRLQVRVITPPGRRSPWVLRALRADRSAAVTEHPNAHWPRLRDERFDGLTIFHGGAPAEAVDGSSLVFLSGDAEGTALPSRVAGFALGPRVERPRWTDVSPVDPRVRFVGVADTHLAWSRELRLAAGETPLVTGSSGPLIAARDDARGSSTLAAFDPDHSDWPLRPSWVFFLRDAVEHARGRRSTLSLDARRTGTRVRIAAHGARAVTMTGPAGAETLPVHDGMAEWGGGSRVGIFRVERGRGAERVGLSLLDPTETALATAELPWRGAVTQADAGALWERRTLTGLLALAALAVLLYEWAGFAGLLRRRESPPSHRVAGTARPPIRP